MDSSITRVQRNVTVHLIDFDNGPRIAQMAIILVDNCVTVFCVRKRDP